MYRGVHRLEKIHEAGLQTPLGCGFSCGPVTERLIWRTSREEEEESGLADKGCRLQTGHMHINSN